MSLLVDCRHPRARLDAECSRREVTDEASHACRGREVCKQAERPERPANELSQVRQVKGIIFRSCPLLALVAGGAPRDDEGADLVGMLPSNNEEVGDVPDGEIEGDGGVDRPVAGNDSEVRGTLVVKLRRADEVRKLPPYGPRAWRSGVGSPKDAVPVLVDEERAIDAQREGEGIDQAAQRQEGGRYRAENVNRQAGPAVGVVEQAGPGQRGEQFR